MAEAESSILIVDDDAEDLASLQRALQSIGGTLHSVSDPHDVLPAVHRERPDVVILDALLPGLSGSGFDLCKRIKTDDQLKGTRVVIITGVYLRQQYRQEALEQFKADGFLTKPFRSPELRRLVVQLLEKKSEKSRSSFLDRWVAPTREDAPKKRGFFARLFGTGGDDALEAPASIAPTLPVHTDEEDTAPEPETSLPDGDTELPPAEEISPEEPPSASTVGADSKAATEAEAEEGEAKQPATDSGETPAQRESSEDARAVNEVGAAVASASSSPEARGDDGVRHADEPPGKEEASQEPEVVHAPEVSPISKDEAEIERTDEPVTTPQSSINAGTTDSAAVSTSSRDVSPETSVEPARDSAEQDVQPIARRPRFRVDDVPIYEEMDFQSELKRELSKCRRVDRPLTLILVQVADLSQIVEILGKEFHESVLWHVAELATGTLREVDLVGMMSSKDLVALTAFASDKYGGERVVSRIRIALQKNPFRVGEELPPIVPALRFGMSSFPEDGEEVTALITKACQQIEGR